MCFPFIFPIPIFIPFKTRTRTVQYLQPIPGTLVCPQPMVMVTTPTPVPYYSVVPNAMPYYAPVYPIAQYPNQPGVQPETTPAQISDEDIKQVHEMFPNIDKEVIKTVMESNQGNKNSTINSLLLMNSES